MGERCAAADWTTHLCTTYTRASICSSSQHHTGGIWVSEPILVLGSLWGCWMDSCLLGEKVVVQVRYLISWDSHAVLIHMYAQWQFQVQFQFEWDFVFSIRWDSVFSLTAPQPHPWIVTEKSGTILCPHCTCMAAWVRLVVVLQPCCLQLKHILLLHSCHARLSFVLGYL